MYLEKLEIQGFKSFANKNRLEFSGLINDNKRGITAIVGPNGSGKSNIADAVRWALGEQSAKTLRGKKGEDIIFSGSDEKSRLGMAEVSLFLKNNGQENDKRKELLKELSPFDYDELIITRRLHRNGDSEYLINNNRVRLVDVQMLLAKANIGQKTYSVIGQGIVENFLNTSATEKKEFFDEATGVKSFQIKRDNALNKLERSHENLSQAELLLTEISPRLRTLTRQVDKLKKRDQLELKLGQGQHLYYHYTHQEMADKLDEININVLSLEKRRKAKEEELNNILNENKLLGQSPVDPEEEKINEELRIKQEEKNKLIKQAARLQAELSIGWETKGNFDLAWLNTKKDELEAKKQSIKNEIKGAEPHQWLQRELELKEAWQKLQGRSSQLEKTKQSEEETRNEINDLKEKLIRIDILLETEEKSRNNLNLSDIKQKEKKLKHLREKIKTELNNFDIKKEEEKYLRTKNKLDNLEEEIKKRHHDLRGLNEEIKEKSEQSVGKKTISQEISRFLTHLEEIEKEKDLEKIKYLISQARQSFKEKIKNLIGLNEEKVLEKIKNIQEEIIQLSEQRKELGDQLNKIQLSLAEQREEQKRKETDKEKIEEDLKNINEEIKGQANNANLENLYQERENLKNEIIKKETIIKNSDQLSLGKNLDKEKEELLKNLNDCRLKISSQEEKIKILEQNYYNLNRELEEIDNKVNRAQSDSTTDDLKDKKEKTNQQLSDIEEKIRQNKDKLEEININRQEEKKQLMLGQNKAENLRQSLNEINKNLHELELEVARQETRLEDLEKNIKNENLSISEIKKPIKTEENIDINYQDLLEKINNYKKQLEQIGSLDPETEKEFHETKERHDFLHKQATDLSQAINSLEKIITQLDEKIKSRWEKEFKIIAEKFNKYFNILFSGGQAKIIRIEEKKEEEENENRLKKWRKKSAIGLSGVDIQAIPPGKKIQSIAMLSGGERALTAIALICAIINANPSPFVVLDEVDAALDEANSEKLAKILDDLSNQTQFIIITHNRATMRRAEILYGVTMQKDGISRLLSVKLEEAENIKNKK